MILRDYQQEAITSLYAYFATHPDPSQNPVIAMPTGTGKALVIAGFTKDVLTRWPGQRVMMLTHVKELIEQNADKLRQLWPQAPLGIFSAGLGEKSAHMPITFGGVQSARAALKKVPDTFGHIDLVIIDECHLVSPDENAAYQYVLNALRAINPALRVIGLSATPYRLGLGMITDGGVFTDICYDVTGLRAFNRFIDEGYLAPLVPMPTDVEVDVSNVHIRGGEFIAGELEQALSEETTWLALQEAAVKAANRQHWLIFAPGIAKVELVVKMLTHMGISAVPVHSKLSDYERDDNLARFKAGQVRALVNADILTTGFDFPGLDCIILLRATNSVVLHVQILGRGTRPLYAPGFDLSMREGRLLAIEGSAKQSCLVLDFAGNTQRLGPINDPRIPTKKKGQAGDMPLKVCDACGCLNHISARFCINPDCGAEFTFEEKISAKASTVALIVRDEPQIEGFKVDRVTYAPHVKFGSPPSLKVSYFCGKRRFTEWICLEHEGNPIQARARKWWRGRSTVEPPDTINEALSLNLGDVLAVPDQIRVWVNKPKFPEIMDYYFVKEPTNV